MSNSQPAKAPNNSKKSRFLSDTVFVYGTLAVLTVVSAWLYFTPGYYISKDVFVCQWSGYSALAFLAFSLLFGPVLRVASWFNFRVDGKVSARLSRNTGIASALAALLHAAIALTTYMESNWYEILSWPYLYAGLLALIILALLLIGSIKQLMTAARWQLWKPTFRLSMAAAVLVFYHVLYAPFASLHWTLGLWGAGLVIFFLRFAPAKQASAPKPGPPSSTTSPSAAPVAASAKT